MFSHFDRILVWCVTDRWTDGQADILQCIEWWKRGHGTEATPPLRSLVICGYWLVLDIVDQYTMLE